MKNDKDAIDEAFRSLFLDYTAHLRTDERPLLAHYTSIQSLEKILSSEEIWFSNPLFMNDLEEVRFGVLHSVNYVNEEEFVSFCQSNELYVRLREKFLDNYIEFEDNQAFDIYVFCLSKHDPQDMDGVLSMWRGYGESGNGAAIVFDTSKFSQIGESPLIVSPVDYQSTTDRKQRIEAMIHKYFILTLELSVPDDFLYLSAFYLFQNILLYALTTKHPGFIEENEWRVIYIPTRDVDNKLSSSFHYSVGRRGIAPKLRFKFEPIPGVTVDSADEGSPFRMDDFIERIILGPSASSPLAAKAIKRMLSSISKNSLCDNVVSSEIPLRPDN